MDITADIDDANCADEESCHTAMDVAAGWKTKTIATEIDDSSPTEPYHNPEQSSMCRAKNVHMGQAKLLLAEMDFLAQHASQGNLVVYAGAADGLHIPTLDAIFARLKLRWQLFDPEEFSLRVKKWQATDPERIRVFRQGFSADAFLRSQGGEEEEEVLFISDIRSSGGRDEAIMRDQATQMAWVLQMQPKACCLKFRGPYDYTEETRYFDYLDGKMRLQAWAGPNSTELRLVCTKPYDALKRYDSKHLEEAMAWHNRHGRNDKALQNLILQRCGGALAKAQFAAFMNLYALERNVLLHRQYSSSS